tara:strand:- start:15122 stop:15697 length:576 start_codon:yes stop_codon:yes gene_type:complete
MIKGDKRTIKLPDEEREAEYLGKGRYCTAWRDIVLPNTVWLITKENDWSKEILMDAFNEENSKHLPLCGYLGYVHSRGWKRVYRTEFSETLTAKHKAWKLIKNLEYKRREANRQIYRWQDNCWWGYEAMHNIVDDMEESSEKEALEALMNSAANYGSSWTFEFAPRNCGISKKGELLFRDCVFNLEEIWKK